MRQIRGLLMIGMIALFGLGSLVLRLYLTDPYFAKTSLFDSVLWEEHETGYLAYVNVPRSGLVCVCGGYECPPALNAEQSFVEPTHLAFEGRLRPSYLIVKDPAAGDHPGWGRPIHSSDICLLKSKGDAVTLELQPNEENEWLLLSIN